MKGTTKPFIVGRDAFAKISAIEGISLSPGMQKDFETFDTAGLSPQERRKALAEKYGKVR